MRDGATKPVSEKNNLGHPNLHLKIEIYIYIIWLKATPKSLIYLAININLPNSR
jgi:hypothetical protein